MNQRLTTAVFLATLVAAPLEARQVSDTTRAHIPVVARDTARAPMSAAPLVAGGVLGSAAGLALGATAGYQLGIGGGDDPGLGGTILFGALGSALGTAAGVSLASSDRISFHESVSVGFISIIGGLIGAWVVSESTGGALDGYGASVGYVVGQGVSAGMLLRR